MIYNPRPHQQKAYDFLRSHKRCALFLDMGMGKTVISLTYIAEMLRDFALNKVIVFAPKRVAELTWAQESKKWEHLKDLRVSKVLGTEKQRIAALETAADIYVINRENTEWLVSYYGADWPFDGVVIDELSSYKNSGSRRWRALRKVIGLALIVIGLTGTPAPNGYMDLWSEVYLIDKGERLEKTKTAFRDKYFNPGARSGHIVYEWRLKKGAKEAIDQRLRDICLSMSAEDWLDLPERIHNVVPVVIPKEGRKIYDAFQRDRVIPLLQGELASLKDMDSAVIGDTAAVVSGKLLQMANGAVYDDSGEVFHIHDAKLDALAELADTEAGKPLLVFYSYQHDLSRIKERFPKAVELKGEQEMNDWNAGKIPMLLAHPASAGHGLNLQEGGHLVVWFGLPWSLELYQQANKRLHRMGQTETVIVHHLVCENTLDERVMAALGQKDSTQKSLLDALKDYLVEEGTADG